MKRFYSFPGTLLLITALMIPATLFSQQNCAKCDKRTINCWDIDVLVDPPSTPEDSIAWKQLFKASKAYYARYVNVESRACLDFLPACRIGSDRPPWEVRCPYRGQNSGGVFDFDISGEITGKEGAYSIRLYLTTLNREMIAEVTKPFEKASDAAWMGEFASEQLGGTATGSKLLNDLIREWEIKKRDEANGVRVNRTAINASLNILNPPKRIMIGKKRVLNIEVKDCDGIPIRAAELILHVIHGKFEKEQVETDENGIAKATYVAPGESVKESITVQYMYDRPGGKEMSADTTIEFEVTGNPSVSISTSNYNVMSNTSEMVTIVLDEDDPESMKTAKLGLSCEKGKLNVTTVIPDADGNAFAVYTPSKENAGIDHIRVDYKYNLQDGTAKQVYDIAEIMVHDPQEKVTGRINVRIYEKVSEMDGDDVIRTKQSDIGYSADVVVKLIRENLAVIEENKDKFNNSMHDMAVAQGDSYLAEWGEGQTDNLLSPIDVIENITEEGYRDPAAKTDWGLLWHSSVNSAVKFQHVVFFIKPYINERITSLVTKRPDDYMIEINVPLVFEQIKTRDYASTSNGTAIKWEEVVQEMVEVPPPYSLSVPYANDIFERLNDTDLVMPPRITAKEFDDYIIKTMGPYNISSIGKTRRVNQNSITEITMEINIGLYPGGIIK